MDTSGQLAQLLALLSGDPTSSATLQSQLDASQATVSRLLRRAGEHVLRIGRGRATRYAATRRVLGGSNWVQPIFCVEELGRITQIATLRALVAGSYVVEALGPRAKAPLWLLGDAGDGVFPSLPYFLFDLRPAGFLGRQIARRLAREGQTPPDPRDWTDEHIGAFLLHHGYDLPGALVVGEAAALRAQHHEPLIVNDRAEAYPRLANAAIRDEAPGSSAAGEQPKFAVYTRQAGHVIVKFSPSADSPEAQRWRDLLRAEAHALQVLDESGRRAATSEIFSFEARVFLESRRFDRDAPDAPDDPDSPDARGVPGGRHLVFSLAMVDAEFAGVGM
ncbi:MAG: HipA domain-containing protein, partial [Deltaproteobacteria bacterium]|nr:HipA domain-containing protein [Deltaproteobacteria bacterium]